MIYQAQIGQDRFALDFTNHKRNGVFVDIGAGHPVEINNTHVLEKEYGWTGISIDIGGAHRCEHLSEEEYEKFWNTERDTPIIVHNALTINYADLFEEMGLPEVIDYLSVDLEPPESTLKAFKRLPFEQYKFNTITFETDDYRPGLGVKEKSRKFTSQLDYKRLDMSSEGLWYRYYGKNDHKTIEEAEDWYIHPDLLDELDEDLLEFIQ